jgi:hypothetical protein
VESVATGISTKEEDDMSIQEADPYRRESVPVEAHLVRALDDYVEYKRRGGGVDFGTWWTRYGDDYPKETLDL